MRAPRHAVQPRSTEDPAVTRTRDQIDFTRLSYECASETLYRTISDAIAKSLQNRTCGPAALSIRAPQYGSDQAGTSGDNPRVGPPGHKPRGTGVVRRQARRAVHQVTASHALKMDRKHALQLHTDSRAPISSDHSAGLSGGCKQGAAVWWACANAARDEKLRVGLPARVPRFEASGRRIRHRFMMQTCDVISGTQPPLAHHQQRACRRVSLTRSRGSHQTVHGQPATAINQAHEAVKTKDSSARASSCAAGAPSSSVQSPRPRSQMASWSGSRL